jgi:hypothetical protein
MPRNLQPGRKDMSINVTTQDSEGWPQQKPCSEERQILGGESGLL